MKKLVNESLEGFLSKPLNEKFDDCSIDVLDYERCIEIMQEEHPEYRLDYSPHPTKSYRYYVTLFKGNEYIGALKGPVSLQHAYEFYKNYFDRNEKTSK